MTLPSSHLVVMMAMALLAACEGDVVVDCSGRSRETCYEHPDCGLVGRVGCRNRCDDDDDCVLEGTSCRDVSFVPAPDAAEDWGSFSGLACLPD